MCLPVVNLGTSSLRTSQDSGGPGHIYLMTSYLEFLWWVREFLTFRRKGEAKRFTESYYQLLKTHLLYYLWRVVEISTSIGSHVPPWRIFPGDIPPRFLCSYGCSNLISPYSFQKITLGLVIPELNTKITRARANLKPMAQAKQFSGFDILHMRNQKFLEVLG